MRGSLLHMRRLFGGCAPDPFLHVSQKSVRDQAWGLGQSSWQVTSAVHETDSSQSASFDSIEEEQLVKGAFYGI